MRTGSIALFFCLLFSFSFQQEKRYPPEQFRLPLDGPLRLSGTFGELRPGHFHSGLDIKGYVGQPLLATAAGFISRIEVRSGGYGKAIYLSHPNGYTSVYAHLDRFSPEVEEYVKSNQYAHESFEVELLPESNRFPFEAGAVVGYIGLTGHSFGPHLHFELRESGGGPAINPLLFGLKIADHRPPAIQALRLYLLSQNGTSHSSTLFPVRGSRGAYRLSKGDTLYTDSPSTAFSLKAFDQLDGADNWDGIYELQFFINDSLSYAFHLAALGPESDSFLDGHIDYSAQTEGEGLFNRCYRMPGNALDIYDPGDGIVALAPGGKAKLTFLTRDLAGNTARLECWLKRRLQPTEKPEKRYYNYFLPFNEPSIIRSAGMEAYFPDSAFYEDLYFDYQATLEESYQLFSLVHHLHNNRSPVHREFYLAIRPNRLIPDGLKDKAFIAYCNSHHEIVNCGGQWKDGSLHAQVRQLGDYCIMLDETPPDIEPLLFQEDMRQQPILAFRIGDNVQAGAGEKGLQYRGTIDGRWVLFSYDEKRQYLEHRFEKGLPPGKHQLRLEVVDGVGNRAAFEGAFLR